MEMNFVDLPVLYSESSFHMTGKGLARLRIARIFEVVVTDRELRVRFFDVGIVNNADIAATENRPFIWIASDGKLSQIQSKLFSKINRKDKGTH